MKYNESERVKDGDRLAHRGQLVPYGLGDPCRDLER